MQERERERGGGVARCIIIGLYTHYSLVKEYIASGRRRRAPLEQWARPCVQVRPMMDGSFHKSPEKRLKGAACTWTWTAEKQKRWKQ